MKKLIIFFVLVLLIACGKQQDKTSKNLDFSGKYVVQMKTDDFISDVNISMTFLTDTIIYKAELGNLSDTEKFAYKISGDSIFFKNDKNESFKFEKEGDNRKLIGNVTTLILTKQK